MMFFHRHKGDLGEIQGKPRELRFCGSDGKQEEKRERERESNPRQEKRQKERERAKVDDERHVRDTIFTPAFHLCMTSC